MKKAWPKSKAERKAGSHQVSERLEASRRTGAYSATRNLPQNLRHEHHR